MQTGQIVTDYEITLQRNKQIGQVVVGFFEQQFHAKMLETDYTVIYQIRKSISDDENEATSRILDQDEVKKVVFALNRSSACGPDGFTGNFFKCCWEIIEMMLLN